LIRLISGLAIVVVGLVVIVFSISNRDGVNIDLWPLPFTPEIPIYVIVWAAGVVGFFAGGVVAWFSAGRVRRRARSASRKANSLEKDLGILKQKIDDLEDERKERRTNGS
jgi:putative membrane protein